MKPVSRRARFRSLSLGLMAAATLAGPTSAQETRLLRHPTVSRELIAFAYGGDLWVVPRSGGTARRLTATPGVKTEPAFSPDGSLIAFTATVAGNTDVYVVPSAGGDPATTSSSSSPAAASCFARAPTGARRTSSGSSI